MKKGYMYTAVILITVVQYAMYIGTCTSTFECTLGLRGFLHSVEYSTGRAMSRQPHATCACVAGRARREHADSRARVARLRPGADCDGSGWMVVELLLTERRPQHGR
jgi:hypothetical protein